jgi:ATP-dependent helicase/nuclease subunit A
MHDTKLMSLSTAHDPDNPGPFVWMRSIKQMPEAVRAFVEASRERAREEYRRLLYVGMTRARDRLYVVGIDKGNIKPENDRRWHKLVRDALGNELTDVEAVDGTPAQEWRATAPPQARATTPATADAAAPTLPDWIDQAAPPPTPAGRRITPSSVVAEAEEAEAVFRPGRTEFLAAENDAGKRARERGKLVHRLLESLPDLPADRRAEIGKRFLDAFAENWQADERAALLTVILAILDRSEFAEAFAPGSRAEVEIAGRIATEAGMATVAGRVDRLAVADDRILIVDYKTNRPAPQTLNEVPAAYVAQLALYRLVLRSLYPGKIVAAALLWTDGPALMEVPDDMLNQAESRLKAT